MQTPPPAAPCPARRRRGAFGALLASTLASLAPLPAAHAAPRVVVISLDGATPRIVNDYLDRGVLPADRGLGLLRREGVSSAQSLTITPSLTAPGHIALATGSTAASNDINGNSFSLLASPFGTTVSGFSAPIGGYGLNGPTLASPPTAEPVWVRLRQAGRKVVAATFPGADGLDVRVPGLGSSSPVVEPATPRRTVDFTVPFGEFGGVSARGFELTAADFTPAPAATVSQLAAAGRRSFSPALQKTTALETFAVNGVNYELRLAALDSTDDGRANYDTLVFFTAAEGIRPGPFALPSTGPAYVSTNVSGGARSAPFYLENSPKKAGVRFYLTNLAPDLSTVRFIRSSAQDIPRNAPVLADVDDINNHVGFWDAQPDFRITERLAPSFKFFPDSELEFVYEEQVRTWTDYQTRVALRALQRNPDADAFFFYFEQPDGSEHQFLLTDPRQATDPADPGSIGAGQDRDKVARYARYVEFAYQQADLAVQRVIAAVGTDPGGRPLANVLVVSDHGFETFHTAVSMNNLLRYAGFDASRVNAVTTGPAVNIYLNLAGRSPGGTVQPAEYLDLQRRLADLLNGYAETNPNYLAPGALLPCAPVFGAVFTRPNSGDPNDPNLGRAVSGVIGQDAGDVFALLNPGYNFDGAQSPPVARSGDPSTGAAPVLSVPNFYGAHGYDPALLNLSAIFFAAGPDIAGRGPLARTRNIDVAPTVAALLSVEPAPTVQGRALDLGRSTLAVSAVVPETSAGRVPGEFLVTRASGAAGELVVRYSVGGGAAPGRDYAALSGSVVLPAGAQSVAIPVRALNPAGSAGARRAVKLTLTPDAAYQLAPPARAKVRVPGQG